MIEENEPDLAAESEMDWGNLEAQAANVDDVNTPESAKESPPEDEISSGDLVAQAIQVTADFIAPNWNIKPEESEQLGNVYGALLDKYMPDSDFSKYGLELSALLVTGMILKSRAGVPLRKKEKKNPEQIAEPEQQEVYQQSASSTLTAKAVSNV
jgi:hypothetical protein